MTELDTLIARQAPPEASRLDALEDGVWLRVAQVEARSRARTLRFAALCVAAGIGALAGTLPGPRISTDRGELSVFSPSLASTPLDARRVLG